MFLGYQGTQETVQIPDKFKLAIVPGCEKTTN